MTNIENEYKKLMETILYKGLDKADRTGTGTKSIFGTTIRHDMSMGFPLLTGKRVSFKAAKTELLWILQGRTDETLGPVYGKQWRDFGGIDQLWQLVYNIRFHPNSRRLMVSAWNPAEMKDMVLPPCHYAFQVYVNDGKLDLMWQQRSADVFLGLPYDIAMYGLLLELLAKGSNMQPGQLIGQLGDCHLYNNHLDQAKIYLGRSKRALPNLFVLDGVKLNKEIQSQVFIPQPNEIKLINYNPYPAIKAELSVGK